MTEIADRYRRIAGGFTARATAVPADAWDNPAPCEGWVARDVVRHMVEWMPGMFFDGPGFQRPAIPSVDDDPVAAWISVSDGLQHLLETPDLASREFEMQVGRFTIEDAIDMFGTGDVLVHTWDLARATGLDEILDPDEVHRQLEGYRTIDEEMLRGSGHFGPRVEVPADVDEQTQLIAFTGRHP